MLTRHPSCPWKVPWVCLLLTFLPPNAHVSGSPLHPPIPLDHTHGPTHQLFFTFLLFFAYFIWKNVNYVKIWTQCCSVERFGKLWYWFLKEIYCPFIDTKGISLEKTIHTFKRTFCALFVHNAYCIFFCFPHDWVTWADEHGIIHL